MMDKDAIVAALHHYESVLRKDKRNTYVIPIIDGLKLALKKLNKYDEIINFMVVK